MGNAGKSSFNPLVFPSNWGPGKKFLYFFCCVVDAVWAVAWIIVHGFKCAI